MLPSEFLKRIETQAYIDAAGLTSAFEVPSFTSVRINTRKWPDPLPAYERVEWEPDGYYLPGRPLFTGDPLFHAGVYYPQESSSMFAGEMFRQLIPATGGIRILDLCGAPGGKSTHLATLAGDDGLLVANEVIRSRASVLAENITKWGTGNVIVTNADPSRFASLPGFFDLIIADAPCSGEGMFRSEVAVREWSVQNARLCSERQRRIVMEAWPSLRPGGILIYSTCTFSPAENEENVAWLGSVTGAESLTVSLPAGSNIVPVRFSGVEGYGFHPGRVRGDGFFIAALRKPPGHPDQPAGRTGRVYPEATGHRAQLKNGLRPSPEAFSRSELFTSFGRDRLVMLEGRIIALAAGADLFNHIYNRLPVIKAGTMIGEVRKNELVPAHDLAMSVRQREGSWPERPLTLSEAVDYLQLESLKADGMPAGRVLVTYRGVALGFVNNIGNRVNNGYPRQWRIRMDMESRAGDIL
jgi:16S rRNA C967 or C1407 C5-methylase (RsmB/RsmF family)/NOL1/NOP2/fmu family ribosome biogenesis protein